MIDRSAVARALAKAIAFKMVGKDHEAADWARELVRLLEVPRSCARADAMTARLTPAAMAVRLLGAKRIAHRCGVSPAAVWKWCRVGAGRVPAKHQATILDMAREKGVVFTPGQIMGVELDAGSPSPPSRRDGGQAWPDGWMDDLYRLAPDVMQDLGERLRTQVETLHRLADLAAVEAAGLADGAPRRPRAS